MSYIALYRKWRPSVFEDVVEQEHVVKALKYSVSSGRIAHAYLFCGTRGTGKTTMAHILSRAINCLNPRDGNPCNECEICRGILTGSILDVLEMDAASNNSVDNIRDIRDEVVYTPSQAKYKVYIIDEVHMLSTGAFNALLKTLEEPPSHVVFILATTEPHKLPATILSRCQRYDFRRISVESISKRLDEIASANNISIQREALRLIAKMSDGALRDAISLLDQCMSSGSKEISYEDVLAIVGIVKDTFIADMVNAVNRKDAATILTLVDKLVMDGKDITQFVSDLIYYYRNLLICKIAENPSEIIDAYDDAIEIMKSQCANLSRDEISYIIKELSLLESGLKWSGHPRILLEVGLFKISDNEANRVDGSINERLSALERKINSGVFSPVPAAKVPSAAPPSVKADDEAPRKESFKSADKSSTGRNKNAAPADIKYLDGWEKLLNELKSCGRMVLYTYLIGTKAVEIDDRIVGIVFDSGASFNKMLCSKAENAEIIEETAAKVLGRKIKIKCLDEDSVAECKPKAVETEEEDFMKKARDMAKKLNVPLNIIEE